MARVNYFPRVLGFLTSFIVIGLLGIERGWSYWDYFFLGAYFLIYPHFVLLTSKLNPGKKKIEMWAMMFDSFVLGIWSAHIHFFLWMSYSYLSATILNSIMVGGFRQMFKSVSFFIVGCLIWGTVTGFRLEPEAAFYIEILAMASLLMYLCSAAWAFYKQTRRLAEIRMELEDKNNILNKTVQELQVTRDELVKKAHKVGMADLATGVLHNIGNILNSVNISTAVIDETIQKSKIPKFKQANQLLNKHKDNLKEFLLEDDRGMKLMDYYRKLEQPLVDEHEKLKTHCNRLADKVQLMLEVIDAQQEFARVGRIKEKVQLSDIVEDTLTLQAGSIERHGLTIQKDFNDKDKVVVQKSKLIHILVNLVKNAKEAMAGAKHDEKLIVIRTYQDEDYVYLSVTDNGEGIKPENLKKIFKHGFTTKQKGHGYGLHTCANYISEMKGKINATSNGAEKGATFTLSLPRHQPADEKNKDYEVFRGND